MFQSHSLAPLALAALALALPAAAGTPEATLFVGSVGAEPGSVVRVPLSLTTEDLVGAFDLRCDASGLVVVDVDYTGLLFSSGWDGWDTAPEPLANVSAACIFPQDQVHGVELPLIDFAIEVPADATPGSEIVVGLQSVTVTDYSFVPYQVTIVPGTIHVTAAACGEDVSGDGMVGFGDLLAVIAAWGPCAGCAEDVDASGLVDLGDVLRVLANWGACD